VQHDRVAAPPLAGDAVFHCQQAVEKAFKAFLTWHDHPCRKTHNLEELGEACLRFDESLRPLVDRAVPLTEYAWRFRYPGDPGEPSLVEVGDALAVAREAYEQVVARLPFGTAR
jgi:HEPN domain-containing protein